MVRRLPRSVRFYWDTCTSVYKIVNHDSGTTHLGDNRAHVILPSILGRHLGKEQPVCTGTDGGHQCKPSTVSAHDLNHESTLVGEGGIEYVVDSITDAGQGRVASDGGVCARHIIVNGTHQADNVQHLVRFDLLCG